MIHMVSIVGGSQVKLHDWKLYYNWKKNCHSEKKNEY